MVLMAGSGHIAYRWGIPTACSGACRTRRWRRGLRRRQGRQRELADYLVFSPEVELPKAGLLGLYLDTTTEGVKVRSVADDSAAVRPASRPATYSSRSTASPPADLRGMRMAMLNMRPGDSCASPTSAGLFGEPAEKTVEVV